MTPSATPSRLGLSAAAPPHPIRTSTRSRKQTRTRRGEVRAAASGGAPRLIALDVQAREDLRNAAFDRLAMTREPGWLAAFVRRAWAIIDPDPLIWNWHYTLLCDELERIADGRTRELVISVPPGTGKSILVSALFPAALWLRDPGSKILALAHLPKNVTRDSRRHRDVITSAWYRGLVDTLAREEGIGLVDLPDGSRGPWTLADDQNEKVNFANTAHGSREIGTVKGGITGTRCNGLIVDDAYDAKQATDGTPTQIAERMDFVVSEYDGNWHNRVHPTRGWKIVIMQGLAEGDLADVLVRRGVRRVVLPMVYDPALTVLVKRGDAEPKEERLVHRRDPRAPGDLLFPRLYSAEWCAKLRATPGGARIWGPQYQQVRGSLGGRLFPRAWMNIPPTKGAGLQRYSGPPSVRARTMDHLWITVDCTFGDSKGADRVAVQGWGTVDGSPNRFLLDRVADRMDIAGTMAAIAQMAAKLSSWAPGKLRLVLIEKTANGPAVITLMSGGLANLRFIAYSPRGAKLSRARITHYAMQAATIWYPLPDAAPWVGEVVEQHVAFTGAEGGVDDDVDAESQLMIYLDDESAEKPDDALERITKGLAFLGGGRKR